MSALALLLEANANRPPVQVQTIRGGTAKDRQANGGAIEPCDGMVDVVAALVPAAQVKQGQPLKKVLPGFRWSHWADDSVSSPRSRASRYDLCASPSA